MMVVKARRGEREKANKEMIKNWGKELILPQYWPLISYSSMLGIHPYL
jgi:hypothetical protein